MSISGGVVMLCTQGKATIVTGIETLELVQNATTMFLNGSSILLVNASDDFSVRMWSISYALYEEIIPSIPPAFVDFLTKIPAYIHSSEALSLQFVRVSMDMAQLLYLERSLQTASTRIKNFALNYILYLFDYISPFLKSSLNAYVNREYMYRRFIADIYNFCEQEHDLQFYASRLCISKRYLSQIVRENAPEQTPKQLIDKQLIFKVKSLLASTDLTITQIADQLHFPDQSYLSRFFKRHAGIYPSEYKKSVKRTQLISVKGL